jgi:hypothetical protein
MNMKKSFKLFNLTAVLVLALYSQILNASTTNVSATVTSGDGQAYNSGIFIATFVPDPNRPTEQYTVNGVPFTKNFTGNFNSAGLFTVTVTDNSTVSPANSKWDFTVCSKTSAPCTIYRTSVTGATVDLSTQISAIAPAITINANANPGMAGAAYTDAEVNKPVFGTMYYNTTSSTLRTYNGTVWASAGGGAGMGVNIKTDCPGVVGDGVTDDGPAITACSLANQFRTLLAPKTQAINSCDYFLGTQVTLYTNLVGEGAIWNSGLQNGEGTNFCAGAGVGSAFNLQLSNCRGTCFFKNFSVVYRGNYIGALTAPAKFVLPSAAALDNFDRSISSIQRLGNVLTVTVSALVGSEKLYQTVGATVNITGVVGDGTMNGLCEITAVSNPSAFGDNFSTFTCNQSGADSGPFGAVGKITLPTTGIYADDGIRICGNFYTFDHVNIIGFPRHGVNADGNAGEGCTFLFADDITFRDSSFVSNQVHGFFTRGGDSSVDLFENNNFYYNAGMAVNDASAFGTTYIGNNFSENGNLWANGTVPPTKNITSVNRVSSVVSVVLTTADTTIQQGNCVVLAGVTDASFNNTAGHCYFVTSVTDSTHYTFKQPGNPVDAASSGGTSRVASFAETYLSSGIDSGAYKLGIGAGSSDTTLINNYMEGAQLCKAGSSTLIINGTNQPICAGPSFQPSILATQWLAAGSFAASLNFLGNKRDFSYELFVHAGSTVSEDELITFNDFQNNRAWNIAVRPTGTAGGSGYFEINSQGFGQTRLIFFGKDTSNGDTYLNGEGTGSVNFNKNFGGTNSGTGGVKFWSGGAAPAQVGSVDSTGLATFNGGVKFSSGGIAQTGTQGSTGTKVFSCTGSFVSGNLVKSDANGNCIDAGAVADITGILTAGSIKNSTTFSNVAGMSWSILASTNYVLNCQMSWSASVNTAGPQFQLTGPAAPTAVLLNMNSAVTATTVIFASANAFSTPVANTGVVTTATPLPASITAGIVNGANAGTLVLQAAANGAGSMTLLAGDSCTLHQQ